MIPQPTDRRIDRLIQVLVEHATMVTPGPKIAAEAGVTRYRIWAWIERLRRLGVDIQGHARSGYQLLKLPDLLVPSLVQVERGDGEIGNKVVHYFLTDSTNSAAMRLASEGAAHGTVVVAEEQTSGRGRLGRDWYSEKFSGIYTSVILRPTLPPSAVPILSLTAGLAAYESVKAFTGMKPDIRWPNDLLLNGRKVGGILTEMSAELDQVHAVILGIGLNVNHREMPPHLKGTATSLRIEGHKSWSRVLLMTMLLRQVQSFYDLMMRQGSAAIAARWGAASTFAFGKRIRVGSKDGQRFATTLGLDPNGALRVRFDGGDEQSLISGEVTEAR
jgi:BirA family transcriptional regulator, biotin operon repressor / biotin---[acetyl-CoA-carboxylase] ligase